MMPPSEGSPLAAGVYAYPGTDVLDDMAFLPRYHGGIERELKKSCGRAPGRRVLDFGAGNGAMAERMRAAGFDLLCIEADPELRARVRARGLEVAADLSHLGEASFDCIYSLNVLEHLHDDQEWVRYLWGLLRPGGLFFIYVPAFPLLYSSFDRSIGHVRRYTRRTGRDLFRPVGGAVCTCVYRDVGGFFVALIFRLLARRGGGRPGIRALRLYDRWVVALNRLLDPLLGRFLGKNLMLVVEKEGRAKGSCAP